MKGESCSLLNKFPRASKALARAFRVRAIRASTQKVAVICGRYSDSGWPMHKPSSTSDGMRPMAICTLRKREHTPPHTSTICASMITNLLPTAIPIARFILFLKEAVTAE